MAYELSIVVPARNEVYHEIDLLHETLQNLLRNTTAACQIVTVLDGYWPPVPIPVHPRITVLHHNRSIGQRAATNEGARVATGEWVCKLDSHCAVDKDFDVKLLEGAEPHWTIVAAQYNLLAFVWKCKSCGHLKDQSPKPAKCTNCGSRYFKQVKEWRPRDGSAGTDVDRQSGKRNTLLKGWRFDTKLEYQQWGALSDRFKGQPIHDTMSLLGACWAMRRDRYWEIEPCDEKYGSWGQQGTEIACKTWLSGGELKVNTTTWFAHFFRVGGIGFPYADGGRKERAMARCREHWLQNRWEKQVYPLSWLIDRFRPPDWETPGNSTRALVDEAGVAFMRSRAHFIKVSNPTLGVVDSSTRQALSMSVTSDGPLAVSSDTVSLSGFDSSDAVTAHDVLKLRDQLKVDRVTATSIIAGDVVQLGNIPTDAAGNGTNRPCIQQPMNVSVLTPEANNPVTIAKTGSPEPVSDNGVNFDLREDTGNLAGSQVINDEVILGSHDSASDAGLRLGSGSRVERDSDSPIVPRKAALYYSCLSHDETLELAARNNLKHATNGHEIGCVTLGQRVDFGDWSIVIDRQKSGGTMHHQILAGLERSTADYVFLCESDVLYSPSHFQFTPPDDATFYYNTNVWRVRYSDGHAVRTNNLQQVSGICASRQLLLDHYRRRVELIEQNGEVFDTKRMAYEPGTRGKFGDERVANWESPFPNLDITGHGQTLTVPHFSVESFRNKRHAVGWMETDGEIPGWGKISGRIQEFLIELAGAST